MTQEDAALLQQARQNLETESFAMKIAARVGVPFETLMRLLPEGAQDTIGKAVNKALEQCLQVALLDTRTSAIHPRSKRLHTAATALTGAVGGFFGLPGLALELPITTTVMLHSIAEIARSYGEDLTQPEAALSCLEVFALGPDHPGPKNISPAGAEASESAYYATRAALAQVTREAASYVAEKGLAKEGAPALIAFIARVAARFGLEVTEKAAAQLVPIAGAAGGLTLNVMFTNHFQRLAEGHFAIRHLERKYGQTEIHTAYESLP